MMAAIIAALATLSGLAPGDAATPAPLPPSTDAPSSPLHQAQSNLDQAQQIYTQSCADRAYGAYDDLCEQLSIQVRKYRIDVDKLERSAEKSPPSAQTRPNL